MAGQEDSYDAHEVTTSYDFDAPIGEPHRYTEKYRLIQLLHQKLVTEGRLPKLALPEVPDVLPAVAYGNATIQNWLPLESLLKRCTKFVNAPQPVPMEVLNHGLDYGQRYGFVLYRVEGKPIQSYEVRGEFCVLGNKVKIASFKCITILTFNAHSAICSLPRPHPRPRHLPGRRH